MQLGQRNLGVKNGIAAENSWNLGFVLGRDYVTIEQILASALLHWEETALLPSRPMHLPLGGNPQAGIGEAIHSVKTHSPLTERAVVRLTAGRTDGRTECINRLRKSVSRATLPSLARLSWR